MCGIFGFAKKGESQSDFHLEKIKEITERLAEASVIRGSDSTGLAIVSPRFHNIWKSTLSSTELVEHSDWDRIMSNVDRSTTAVIGHVRFATHGEITARNSHPFSIGGVIGAHNGVIHNHSSMDTELGTDSEVDSEVIFGAIDKLGTKEGLEKLNGDYALTFVKDNPYEVYLAREYSRPMQYTYWKKARTLFWASTDEILQYALQKSGMVLETKSLVPNTIFKLDTREFGKEVEYEYEKFTPDDSYYYGRYYPSNYNVSTKVTSSSAYSEPCPLCGKDTYSSTGICWTCNHNPSVEALCERCGHYQSTLGMICDKDGTCCKGCQETIPRLTDGCSNSNVYDFCDGCSETVPSEMLKTYGLYSLCTNCDGDADMRMVVNGGYCA